MPPTASTSSGRPRSGFRRRCRPHAPTRTSSRPARARVLTVMPAPRSARPAAYHSAAARTVLCLAASQSRARRFARPQRPPRSRTAALCSRCCVSRCTARALRMLCPFAPLTKRLDSLRVLTRRPPRRLLRHRPSGTRRCASSRARREISTTSRYAPRRNTPSHRHQVREMAGTIEALNGAPRRWWLALPCRVATA